MTITVEVGHHYLEHIDKDSAALLTREIFEAECYGLFAPATCSWIIDCGANCGFATSYLAQRYQSARILAIEPDPASFALLKSNVERNGLGSRVELLQMALGDSAGPRTFYTSPAERPSLRMSLLEERMGGLGQPLEVETCRLSSLILGNVDLLKVDVEGGEVEILRDLARNATLDRIRTIVMEIHHRPAAPAALIESLSHLAGAGFELRLECELSQANGSWVDPYQDVTVWATRDNPVKVPASV